MNGDWCGVDGDWWCVDDDVTIQAISAMGKSEGVRVRKGGRRRVDDTPETGDVTPSHPPVRSTYFPFGLLCSGAVYSLSPGFQHALRQFSTFLKFQLLCLQSGPDLPPRACTCAEGFGSHLQPRGRWCVREREVDRL